MSASQWRIDLARNISTFYNAKAIVIVGSPVLNLADAYSDLDIVMFWETIPPNDERIQIASQYGDIHVVDSFNHKAEYSLQDAAEVIYLGENKLKIDITHKSVAAQNQMIKEIVSDLDSNRSKLGQIHSMSQSVPLKGDDLLENWQNMVYPMPKALSEKLLEQYLHFWAYQPLQKLVIERDDPLFARQLMSDSCEKIMLATCVINGMYPPYKTKHLRYQLQGLEQASQTMERIQQICNEPIMEAFNSLNNLIEDVFDLAVKFGYDTEGARSHYATVRHANETPISLNKERQL